MLSFSIAETDAELVRSLVARAREGEEVVLMDRGVPIGRLMPLAEDEETITGFAGPPGGSELAHGSARRRLSRGILGRANEGEGTA